MNVMHDTSLLDDVRVAELIEEIGEEDLADVMLMFLDEAEREVAAIALGLEDDAHAKATHFVRSGSLNIGLKALADEATRADHVPPAERAETGRRLAGLLNRSRAAISKRWG